MQKISHGGFETIIKHPLISQPLMIQNVGNGPAVHFRIGVSDKNSKIKNGMIPISLKVNQVFNINIYCDNYGANDKNCGIYKLGVYYDDIYGNSYMQIYDCEIQMNESDQEYWLRINLGGKQECSDLIMD